MNDCDDLPSDYVEVLHKRIGRNISRIRKEKSKSQLKLSHAMGYRSVTTVSCTVIYHNKIHFNVEHLSKTAYILDVDICDFFRKIKD